MDTELDLRLTAFAKEHTFGGRGALCVALVVTRHLRRNGLPLEKESLGTVGRGQVAGLGKTQVQSILAKFGIDRILAEEGGRTSRGSIGKMNSYVGLLNDLDVAGTVDLAAVEQWWVDRVREFLQASRSNYDSIHQSHSRRLSTKCWNKRTKGNAHRLVQPTLELC